MDKTKKHIIELVILSFVLIGIITLYNMNASATRNVTTTSQVESAQTQSQGKTKSDTSDSSSNKGKSTQKSKTSAKKTSPKTSSKTSSSSSSNKGSSSSASSSSASSSGSSGSSAKTVEGPSLTITGVNGTMACGNVAYSEGMSAYDALVKLCGDQGLSINKKGSGVTLYISGIGGLKEKQYGPMSGWMYKVNGVAPNKSAGAYTLNKSDTVVFYYVKDE